MSSSCRHAQSSLVILWEPFSLASKRDYNPPWRERKGWVSFQKTAFALKAGFPPFSPSFFALISGDGLSVGEGWEWGIGGVVE